MAAGRYIHTLSNSDDDIKVSDDDDGGVGFKRRPTVLYITTIISNLLFRTIAAMHF